VADRAHLERLSRELTDSGKLIEVGFISLRLACIPLDAPAEQLREMRMAFFAGAQHLFGTIMTILEPGDEPTEKDLKRLDLINAELGEFIKDFEMRHTPTKGTA
jgi:hypothetical protein